MPQYQGVWTLPVAARLQSTQQWATDPLYRNTTLLLQADNAANGAQNNTFLDSSSNNFTISRAGNTTQGTFTPFSQSPGWWSTFFSSSYLTLADSADWVIDTDYTIEFWAYASSFPGQYNNFINQRGGVSSYWGINYDTSLGWSFFWNNGSGETKVSRYQDSPLNTWVHVAIVKSGTTGYMFLNGVQAGATFTFGSISDVASVLYIGAWFTPGDYFNGYLSNLRLVKGRAVYTSNFTPSTIPLGATSGGTNPPTGTQTKLLMSQSNYFIDNSPSPKTISIGGGSPSVQAFSPFAPQYQYTPSVTGGSGYFDGTGDYISAPANAAFDFSTGNFTIEFWYYPDAVSGYRTVLDINYGTAPNCTLQPVSGVMTFYANGTSASISSSATDTAGSWYHYAIVRSGSTITMYRNGTSVGTATYSGNVGNSSVPCFVGGSLGGSGFYVQGYLSNFRIVKGTAVYTSAFTPPTAPLTAITNTQLLLNFTNAGIYDGTLKNNLETVGNAQVSTSVVKYGTGSMYFDGSGDILYIPYSPNFNFGTGDFTVEFWILRSSGNGYVITCGNDASTGNWNLVFASGSLYWQSVYGITNLYSRPAAAISDGAWHHVAITRLNGVQRMFFDGVQQGATVADTNNYVVTTTTQIGLGINSFTGYLDDFRITKGIARYTANFTPPSVALPRQ